MQWRSNRGDGYRPRSKSEGYLQMPSSPALNVDFRPRAPALSARPSSGVAVAHLMHRRLKTRVLSQPRRPSRRPERGRGAHSGRDGTSDREAAWSVTPGGRLQLSAQLSESEHAVRLFSLCIDERFLRCIAVYRLFSVSLSVTIPSGRGTRPGVRSRIWSTAVAVRSGKTPYARRG